MKFILRQFQLRLTGPRTPEEIYLTILYCLIHTGTLLLWYADSPPMNELLDWMYLPWMITFYVSSALLLFGLFLRVRVVEALSLPFVASGLFSNILAVLSHPPYGNHPLGIAASCFLGLGAVTVSWRFGHDIMGWGRKKNVE